MSTGVSSFREKAEDDVVVLYIHSPNIMSSCCGA
jgi:hypothetical protein